VKAGACTACAAATALPFLLSGCFFLSTTRKLPVPKPPATVQSVTPSELVNRLDQRWGALDTLTAKVELQASVLHSKEGLAKDYTTIPGIILMRKPEMLRVFGRVPVIRTELFDMVSDGKNFTLYVPSKGKAIEGPNSLEKKSPNQLENLRPGFFLDALGVRGLDPDDRYTVTSDVETFEDAAKKHLYSVPEYILSIHRPKAGSQEDTPLRVVWFHRDDLLPYQQDIYDAAGNLETQVFYSQYGDFSGEKYPSKVTIKRPIDEIQVILTIESVTENENLPPDQFEIKLPPETVVQKLE
jgi:outer membrane lipoprotein-sorting protein